VLRGFHDVKVVAFADRLLERALTLGRRCQGNGYEDYRTMLDQEEVDALYICVPPFAHGEFERAALERNLPFFVEKPLGLHWEEVAEIAHAVQSRELITAVGYHWRYMTTVESAKALTAQHPPHLVLGYWLDSTPPPAWWRRDELSGGQMVEQTTHIFDLARHLVGEVENVYAVGARHPRPDFPDADIFESSIATLRFASGALGSISSTCLLHWQHRVGLHLFGPHQVLEIGEHEMMTDVGQGRPMTPQGGDPVVRQDRDFIDAILGLGNHIRVPYGEAMRTLRLTLAAARSAKEGREICIEEELTYAS
jgi:predicted dehydrogenase